MFVFGLVWSLASFAQEGPSNWQVHVRQLVALKQFERALKVVEQRLAETSEDLEARGWRARLLVWLNRWREGEAEYRNVLEKAPHDVDILLGLADVLRWQKRFDEALSILHKASKLEPERVEVHIRRGQILRELGQVEPARSAFEDALNLDPTNNEARAGVDSLQPEPRNEFRTESDFEHYSFADGAQSVAVSLRTSLGSRWVTQVGGNFQHRFGDEAARFVASIAYRDNRHGVLTVGGGAAGDQGIIPKGEAFVEYGRGFRVSESSFIRGVEPGYRQRWLWFRDARIVVFTPSLSLYLPRDWVWSVSISSARAQFSAAGAMWQPSGLTRLTFPVHRRLVGNVFFAVGTENFAQADQLGRFSARTLGGGLRWRFARYQEFTGHVFHQDRSQARTQNGLGFGYGIRF